VISLVDSNMEINVVKNDIECYKGHNVIENNVESDDTGCNDNVNIIKSDIIHSIIENVIADVCNKDIKNDSVIDNDTMVINDKDNFEEIFRLDSSNKVLNAVNHDQFIVSDFNNIRKSIVNRVSDKAVGHVHKDLSRNAALGQDDKFNLRCISLVRLLLVFLLVISSLYRSNSVCDDRIDFHRGFVFNRESVVISGILMMIHNHTSYSNKSLQRGTRVMKNFHMYYMKESVLRGTYYGTNDIYYCGVVNQLDMSTENVRRISMSNSMFF